MRSVLLDSLLAGLLVVLALGCQTTTHIQSSTNEVSVTITSNPLFVKILDPNEGASKVEEPPPPRPEKARLTVTSDPDHATILVSDKEFGAYAPWPPVVGMPVTPLDVLVDVGQAFWVRVSKDNYGDSEARFVAVRDETPIRLHIVIPPPPQASLQVTSIPDEATILIADREFGTYKPWCPQGVAVKTEFDVILDVGERFWLDVRKQGYVSSGPQEVSAKDATPLYRHFPLTPRSRQARLTVTSDCDPAPILKSDSRFGNYTEWRRNGVLLETPCTVKLDEGEAFWLTIRKAGYGTPKPQHVTVHDATSIDRHFPCPPRPPQARLTVTSKPTNATVLVSDEEFGHYDPWPPKGATLSVTPLDVMVDVGQAFWLKVRKDRYDTSKPVAVSVKDETPIVLHFDLEPSLPPPPPSPVSSALMLMSAAFGAVQPPAPEPEQGGVEVRGFALVTGNEPEAEQLAILDALRTAIQQEYGGEISARSVAENYILRTSRVEALVSGKYASYKVLERGNKDGLYCVTLRVSFTRDILEAIQGEDVSFLVGGSEAMQMAGASEGSTQARSAAGDILIGAGMRVTIEDQDVPNAKDLADIAVKKQSDMALYLEATAELREDFGPFDSYKTTLDYALVIPASGDIIASGRVEGRNKRGPDPAKKHAEASLSNAGEAAAEEALHKLAQRYDRAAAHTVFVRGVPTRREADALVIELGRAQGVRDVRLLAYQGNICEVGLTIAPNVRSNMSDAVQRLENIDLEVEQSDLYTTVAHVR